MSDENLVILGDFLRRKRESLSPEMMGLAKPLRTRTPGLRREDVAALAGISTVWYSKIERGKASGISYEVLSSLAQALNMTSSEKQYLKQLVVQDLTPTHSPCRRVAPYTQRMLTLINPLPAMLINDYFDIIESNRSFNLLCGVELSDLAEDERNYAYLTLTHPAWQHFLGIDDQQALVEALTRMAGFLRSMIASHPNDPLINKRVIQFQNLSPAFIQAWERNTVQQAEQMQFSFRHATLGPITLRKQIWWNYNGDTSGRLNIYHPETETDYQRLADLHKELK